MAAVLGTMRKLGIAELLANRSCRERDLTLAMLAARVLEPCSKLATERSLGSGTLSSSLGEAVGVEEADADELYRAPDCLGRG